MVRSEHSISTKDVQVNDIADSYLDFLLRESPQKTTPPPHPQNWVA